MNEIDDRIGKATHSAWKRWRVEGGYTDHLFQWDGLQWNANARHGRLCICGRFEPAHHDDMIDWADLPDQKRQKYIVQGMAAVEAYRAVAEDEGARRLSEALQAITNEANYVVSVRPDIEFAVWVHARASSALASEPVRKRHMVSNVITVRFIPNGRWSAPETVEVQTTDRPAYQGRLPEIDTDMVLWLDGDKLATLKKDGHSWHWELEDDTARPKRWFPHVAFVSPQVLANDSSRMAAEAEGWEPDPSRVAQRHEPASARLVGDPAEDDGALRDAARRALDHVSELRDAWKRGALSEHDGQGGTRSNRNVDVEAALRHALADDSAGPSVPSAGGGAEDSWAAYRLGVGRIMEQLGSFQLGPLKTGFLHGWNLRDVAAQKERGRLLEVLAGLIATFEDGNQHDAATMLRETIADDATRWVGTLTDDADYYRACYEDMRRDFWFLLVVIRQAREMVRTRGTAQIKTSELLDLLGRTDRELLAGRASKVHALSQNREAGG